MLFSQRYRRALKENRIEASIGAEMRRKIRKNLLQFNFGFPIQRNPNDSWEDNTSVAEEAIRDVMVARGLDCVPAHEEYHSGYYDYRGALSCVIDKEGEDFLFDTIEAFIFNLDEKNRQNAQRILNDIFEAHESAWRIVDGSIFKLDSAFLAVHLTNDAHETLIEHRLIGAADEYKKARQELLDGDNKDAVLYAAKSFESVMKVITGIKDGNADRLIRALSQNGYLDDLPLDMRAGFAEQVLKTLPFIRNKLVGHGQGASIVDVSSAYGELAIQLSAVMNNFLIKKYLESKSGKHPLDIKNEESDDIPF